MLCEKCKKNQATFFYEENINGNKRSYALCSECAAAAEKEGDISFGHKPQGSFSLPYFGLHDQLFGGLFGHTVGQAQKKKACPLCGATLDDFRTDGKTGCPECYTTFGEELGATIRSIHGNVKHAGRAPARLRKDREKQDRLADLRKQMQEAIASENFEQAAKLRDEIRALEENQ